MHWLISIVGGVAVGFAWLAIWASLLRAFRIVAFSRQDEDCVGKRERLKQMGKLRYILIFGVAGYGLMFGLAMTVAGLLDHDSPGVGFSIVKLLLLSVLFGCFHGVRTWNQAFRDPVPFPPAYPPQK